MARPSAEARAALQWPAPDRPAAPKHLSRDARRVWTEIVQSRPVDFFQPGSLHLLEGFCEAVIAARHVAAELVEAPTDREVIGRLRDLSAVTMVLASKLRLTVQATIDRKSGRLAETMPPADPLLGGATGDH